MFVCGVQVNTSKDHEFGLCVKKELRLLMQFSPSHSPQIMVRENMFPSIYINLTITNNISSKYELKYNVYIIIWI